MNTLTLSAAQLALAARPADQRIFLEGPAGAGKTTAAVARLLHLLEQGVRGDSILVLTPQRTLAAPYTDALRKPSTPAGGQVTVLTLGGLAQRMIELFWPAVAEEAGFAQPDRPPVFLTLETTQYFMARVVRPLLDEGYFDSVALERNRLYSQIVDNLNKAAVVGFPLGEIAGRLREAWLGESSQARVFEEAQACAERFRTYCLAHNLLDFSLQYEVFTRRVWRVPLCRGHLTSRYRHLIADNMEEDTPVTHDLLLEWLPACASALVIYDREAGYRRFLGADPLSAYRLAARCDEKTALTGSFVTSPDVAALGARLAAGLGQGQSRPAAAPAAMEIAPTPSPSPPATGEGSLLLLPVPLAGEGGREESSAPAVTRPAVALSFAAHRFHPEMLDWVAGEISSLAHDQGVAPREIVVLAPFISGGLRFALESRLRDRNVPVRSHRPSRTLREEPVTVCLLTLAALCYPEWRLAPARPDVAHALTLAIADMDLVRAQLLAEIAYRVSDDAPALSPFVEIEPAMQERITFVLGGRYEGLRTWIEARRLAGPTRSGRRQTANRRPELDHLLSRLFGEVLSQPGYGFHRNLAAGEATANLIESARKFRQVAGGGGEYLRLVQEGVVAAQYVRSWREERREAVLIAPAYTFLMSNRPVAHQFWLDVGSTGWWERLNQPLTHPYVLSREWPAGRQWSDADEIAVRGDALARLALGLIRRCRVQIHLGLSELNEQGTEQRGPLLRAIQSVLREL